jgi:hypothetical protein
VPPRSSSINASRAAVRAFLTSRGVGGPFTLLDRRKVLPNATQADRRMRELRQAVPDPWKIVSNHQDRSIPIGTYYIDHIGSNKIAPPVSGRVRREVFEAAGNRCQVCGIGVGEEYAEYPGEFARLQLGDWVPIDHRGSPTSKGNMRSECQRCNGGIRNQQGGVVTAASVKPSIRTLPRAGQDELLRWLEQHNRDISNSERLFYEIRQLPPTERDEVVAELIGVVRGGSGH